MFVYTDIGRYARTGCAVDSGQAADTPQPWLLHGRHEQAALVRRHLRQCAAYGRLCRVLPARPPVPDRTAMGHCSRHPTRQELFCVCCRFHEPARTVVDGVLTNYFLPFYDAQLYAESGVAYLVAVDTLHSIDDAQTVQELLSEKFSWQEIVCRHYSRRHWQAVRSEQERLLGEWTQFVDFVNGRRSDTGWMTEQTATYWRQLLMPAVPEEPVQGSFLVRRTERERLDAWSIGWARQLLETAGVRTYERPQFPMRTCDTSCEWKVHGHVQPREDDAMMQALFDIVEKREIVRRQINACRNVVRLEDEQRMPMVAEPSELTVETFAQRPTTPWRLSEAETQQCLTLLTADVYFSKWTVYNGSGTVGAVRNFVVAEFYAGEVLRLLLDKYRFEESCGVFTLWVEDSAREDVGVADAVFSIAVECDAAQYAAMSYQTQLVLNECCCADNVYTTVEPLQPGQFGTGYLMLKAVPLPNQPQAVTLELDGNAWH